MRTVIAGQPHDGLIQHIRSLPKQEKRDEVVFQHRLSPEKNVPMFLDLKQHMQDVHFTLCQERKQTKAEYHQQLMTPKVAWSASLQETFGIAICVEAPLFGIIPFAPNRLSYAEIFKDYPEFLYPSEWTESWNAYQEHRPQIIEQIRHRLNNYDSYRPVIEDYCTCVLPSYATGQTLINYLLGDHAFG